MRSFTVNEKSDVIIDTYPNYKTLNKKLLEDVKVASYPPGLSFEKKYNFYAKHSDWKTRSKNIDIISSWSVNIIRNSGPLWLWTSHKNFSLYCSDSWFASYKKGDWVDTHKHSPRQYFSFVYFIQTPKGSSPLVFPTSGKRIKAEEGKLVLFSSNIYHHVPKNGCDGRVTLAGNIAIKYDFDPDPDG